MNQDLQVIPLQGGESPEMYAQTLEAANLVLKPEEIRWMNLEQASAFDEALSRTE